MAHDPSNPFHELAKKISSLKRDNAPSRASGRRPANGKDEGDSPLPAAKRSASRRDFSVPGIDDARDAALFLRAVSGASPIRDKDRHSSAGGTGGPGSKAARAERSRGYPPPLPQPSGTDKKTGEKRLDSFHSLQTAPHAPELQGRGEPAAGEDDLLFAKAMQGVSPVKTKGRDVAVPAGKNKAAPSVDPAKALRDLLEGRLEFALHHTDEYVEGYVVGIDPLILARLRAGQFSPEAHIDLHGQNALQARDSLTWFIKNAYQRGLRTILVITGRGRNSPDGVGVLRPLLQRWLPREPFKRVVLAFCTAKSSDGGPGAIYILLRKYKKSRGKIIWEHSPADDDFPDL